VRFVVLAAVALTAVVSAFLLDRIPQDPDYHRFADGRLLFGVSNCWNVATNLSRSWPSAPPCITWRRPTPRWSGIACR
jgi:hypothetical protein